MSDEYLWDRSGEPDPDIDMLERRLAGLAQVYPPPPFETAARPRFRWGIRAGLAAAAVIAIAVAGVLLSRYLAKTSGASGWEIASVGGAPTMASGAIGGRALLPVGEWLETDARSMASLNVGGIGRISIAPGTRVRLLSARSGDHRLKLERGTLHATIWAPPGQFAVETASSTAVDLGCAYTLTMDEEGAGLVTVLAGWVGFEWQGRESFVPAGSMSVTRPGKGPGTPFNERVSPQFREALLTIDFAGASPDAPAALTRVLAEAEERDEVTLWHLLTRVNAADVDRVFDRLAQFVAPPPGVTRDGIRAGRREMLDAWWDALGLGTADWWRTWKQK